MAVKITFNAKQLEMSIQNIAERASKSASAELRKTAIKIRDLARDYAPVKTGLLEKNIEYGVVKDERRRNMFVVYIDIDAVRHNGKGSLGDYAWIMEEELHPYGRRKGRLNFNLGPGSVIKAASGKKVGGRFLSRAIKEGSANLLQDVSNAVRRVMNDNRVMPMSYQRDTGDDE